QAAAAVDSLRMESPVKKLDFGVANKENNPDAAAAQDAAPAAKKEEPAAVAQTVKPEESDEPLLRDNPNRFVLFPIKYHEVGLPSPLHHPRLYTGPPPSHPHLYTGPQH
ncbi:hypothetical protein IMZ48_13430, partial [Candidatus Bathyarchaeota archaeon]|nr:hypothetical protein [Candidatus Bathyarchaeota archaeon]